MMKLYKKLYNVLPLIRNVNKVTTKCGPTRAHFTFSEPFFPSLFSAYARFAQNQCFSNFHAKKGVPTQPK